jgi:fibronectin type 3 domain-containing protein
VAYQAGQTYYLVVTAVDDGMVEIHRTITANEDWDESLPTRVDATIPSGSSTPA